MLRLHFQKVDLQQVHLQLHVGLQLRAVEEKPVMWLLKNPQDQKHLVEVEQFSSP
ncbi:hypothetical protein RchiOBHm_Chr3g0467281 [Rosa chinensis]|uniref:Uncharacterized protein n=1 Tax=Rosa chinensis TaxID=74649 RepID=A0A2P6RA76_ROSCH|nr:hypothetical protein RchiOBHm_Chr3g0467281 [Rosa chinensis]